MMLNESARPTGGIDPVTHVNVTAASRSSSWMRHSWVTTLATIVLVAIAVPRVLLVPAQAQGLVQPAFGINFSPYMDGQDPNYNVQISAAQIRSRMQTVAPYTQWVRSFGMTNGLENTPSIARELNLKIAANAWISGDTVRNDLEIANLISAANAGQVDIAIVGSEAILRNAVSESQLIAYMNQVRQAIPSTIPVTTADVWSTFIAHPNLIAASDVVLANFYPYWEGTSINNAVCSLQRQYQVLSAASGARPVYVSESGWPSAGNAVGGAIPSIANANRYASQFLSWAASRQIPSFYFAAFDEAWKANHGEGPQGAHWGIWDASGRIKPGMDEFFYGQSSVVDCNPLIPGSADVTFTYVPPYGSDDPLEVAVAGVRPDDYVLATYIKVSGQWWTKPTFAQPTVSIWSDGTARIPIATGTNDRQASDILSFLIPVGCTPEQKSGSAIQPVNLCAVASRQAQRTQSSVSGSIVDAQNHPLAGATISDAALGTTTSAPDGKYSFFNIPSAGTATLTVTRTGYYFPQSPQTVSIPSGSLAMNFAGVLPDARRRDFNSDGMSDMLWRDSAGNLAIWLMEGATITNLSGSGVGSVPVDWDIKGTCDLFDEGRSGILWRNRNSGAVAAWNMNGTSLLNLHSTGVGQVPTNWDIVGVGRFFSDSKCDIVWRDTSSGGVAIWKMNGTTINNLDSSGVGQVPTGWHVVGIGDFDGDGLSDLLWRDISTGTVAIWLMNGTSITNLNSTGLGQVPTNWHVASVGDFYSDNRSGILWRENGGGVAIWRMNGTTILNLNSSGVGQVPTNWTISGTGLFNRDLASDILWRETTGGMVASWFMNGTAVLNAVSTGVAQVPTAWELVGDARQDN